MVYNNGKSQKIWSSICKTTLLFKYTYKNENFHKLRVNGEKLSKYKV